MNRVPVAFARAGSRAFASAAATAPKADLNIIRSWGPVGKWLRDQKNHVPEDQKFFQQAHGFTFAKKDSDKLVLGVVAGGTLIGLTLMLRGE